VPDEHGSESAPCMAIRIELMVTVILLNRVEMPDLMFFMPNDLIEYLIHTKTIISFGWALQRLPLDYIQGSMKQDVGNGQGQVPRFDRHVGGPASCKRVKLHDLHVP